AAQIANEAEPPPPADPTAAAERQDLVDYARGRLDQGEAGADVAAGVQALIERRAEAARKAAEHWADEAAGNGDPTSVASQGAAQERLRVTEENAAAP